MSTNISEEEFLRLQDQILELRTANYTLIEKHARQVSWSQQLQSQVEALEKEYAKAQASLNASKKSKNSDLILQNERLQMKLQAQEDEFRLQNQTLMSELADLTKENKRLNDVVCFTTMEANESSDPSDQVKKLQSEASALRRVLSNERLSSAEEISKLKDILQIFSDQMDEDFEHDLFTNGLFDLTPRASRTDLRSQSDEEDSNSLESRVRRRRAQESRGVCNNKFKLVNTCRLAQLELAEALQKREKFDEVMEKRESLEISLINLQTKYDEYKSQSEKKIGDLEDSLQLIVSEQEKQLCVIEKCNLNNSELEAKVEQLTNKLNECAIENEVLNAKLEESTKTIEELNQQLAALKAENQEKVQSLGEVEKRVQEMLEELDQLRSDRDLQVGALEQQLVDLKAEQGLRERKGAVVCRDLKRQLAAERRRVERLQERMREVLEGTHLKTGNDSSKVADSDTASISSWSLMSGNIEQQDSNARESNLVAVSPTNLNGNLLLQSEDLDLEQESKNLLERVASLQEEKWALEEKVNHLEQGNAAMAQDLMKKSKVIKFYCMDGRHDPVPTSSGKKAVKKLSDFLKNSEEEHLQECNARMQRMLEELLTKNMYLQRDIEHLSKEIEELKQGDKPAQ